MSKSCKSCGNYVDCQGRDLACKINGRRLAWIPKPSDVLEKEFNKFLKVVNNNNLDQHALMRLAFKAGIKVGIASK